MLRFLVQGRKLGMFAVLCCFGSTAAVSQPDGRMPKIETIGIVPVQWEGANPDEIGLRKVQTAVNHLYLQAVRESGRFNVLDDHLIELMWQTQEGRAELVTDYELQAFASLAVVIAGDRVTFSNRLLSPELAYFLFENESESIDWLRSADERALHERLARLVFRTFNRLPVDTTVISVHGRYATLSGGEGQGIRIGDKYEVVRPQVKSLHPANGAWLEFESKKKGSLKIIEVKPHSAVAEITAQTYENAIQQGDGFKIGNLKSRDHFHQLSKAPEFTDVGEQVVITPPVAVHKDKKDVAAKPRQMPKAGQDLKPIEQPADTLPTDGENNAEELPAQPEQEEDVGAPLMDILAGIIDEARFSTGIHPWKVAGAASANSVLSPWLLNYFELLARRNISEQIALEASGNLGFGTTVNGSYLGFGGLARGIYYLASSSAAFQRIRLGGEVAVSSLSVSSESFGGHDLFVFGGFAGLEGKRPLFGSNIDWNGDLYLRPMALGQLGYEGSKRAVGSYFEYGLRGGFLFAGAPQEMEWGSQLEYGSMSIEADKKVDRSDIKLLLLSRYRF